jgi:hypothetical protein
MKLLGIDSSRIIYLMQTLRPLGQVYIPDAIAKVKERYSFVKSPNPEQVLPLSFAIGKFREAQIVEFSIYNDGLIVSSASDTDLPTYSMHLSKTSPLGQRKSSLSNLSQAPRLKSFTKAVLLLKPRVISPARPALNSTSAALQPRLCKLQKSVLP